MSQRESPQGSSTWIDDLIRSAVLGFAFGSVLFVLSDQTGIISALLHSWGFQNVAKHLGVKQFAIFGISVGVALELIVKFLHQGRHRLTLFFTRQS